MSNNEKSPKPFFHLSENFSSAYFGPVPEGADTALADAKTIANFISLLTDSNHRERKSEVLAILNNNKAQQFLVNLIADPSHKKHQYELIMACWESGLDFSEHLIFFSELVLNCEYLSALEALTVIDEMQNLTDIQNLKNAVKILSSDSLSSDKQKLAKATLAHLMEKIK